MYGNLREWLFDRYGSYGSSFYYGPTGPASGSPKVMRGGAWIFDEDQNFRSAHRDHYDQTMRSNHMGSNLLLVTDPAGASQEDTNAVPVASNDTVTTNKNVAITIDVLSNDTDADGDQLRVVNISNISTGTAIITSMESTIQVTPAADSTTQSVPGHHWF